MDKPAATLLLADDDSDFLVLAQDALKATGLSVNLQTVQNGTQLLDYLRRRAPYTDAKDFPFPGVVLLDLKMVDPDSRQVLREMQDAPELRRIPVLILTSSTEKADVAECYALGVTSFIVKPAGFAELVELLRGVCSYWFRVAQLPPPRGIS